MPEAELKKGWTKVAFGEVVKLSRERTSDPERDGLDRYVGLDHLEPGDLKIRRWGNIADGTTFTTIFRPGQVLFGKRRAYQRKVALADFSGVCSGDIYVLEAKNSDLLPELLPFICQTEGFFKHAVGTSAGSLSPRTNWDSLSMYDLALPPIDEQLRLANALVADEDYLSSLGEFMQALTNTASALLERFVQGEGGWPLESVHSLLSEPSRNGISPSGNDDRRGLRTVSISSVRKGLFDPTDCIKHADIDFNRAEPYFVRKGDAFVIRGNGNRSLVGRAGLSDASFDDLFFPDLLIRLRFNCAKMLPRFAVAQWNLPSSHARLAARAKSSNGIWKVNGQDIRAHTLRRPPIPEQERVLRDLDAIEHAIQGARERERTLREIKNVLLTTLANHQ